MTTLELTIKNDLKDAMKGGRKGEVEVLRMLLSDAKNAAIAAGAERSDLGDELVMGVLRKGVKSRKESLEMYQDAGREDLAEKEAFQIDVLKRYLPAEMSQAEIEVVVDTVIVELGASTRKDMGKVMQEVLSRLAGRADGKQVSAVVGARLG